MKDKEEELIVPGWIRTKPHRINTELLNSCSIRIFESRHKILPELTNTKVLEQHRVSSIRVWQQGAWRQHISDGGS